MWTTLHKNAFEHFFLLLHRNRKLHIAKSWWWRSLSLCAYHFHMGSWTCIIFSLRYSRDYRLPESLSSGFDGARNEKGKENLQTSLKFTKFVMHFKMRFVVVVVVRLSCFRLRLGFDLFSHSFHNLIKKTSLVLHEENNESTTKEISPFMGEGGWKDERRSIVNAKRWCKVKCYSIYVIFKSPFASQLSRKIFEPFDRP